MTAAARRSLRAAMEAHRRGDLAAAERLYGEVIGENPDRVEARQYLGRVLHQRGSTEEGRRLIERAVALDASDYEGAFHETRATCRPGATGGCAPRGGRWPKMDSTEAVTIALSSSGLSPS